MRFKSDKSSCQKQGQIGRPSTKDNVQKSHSNDSKIYSISLSFNFLIETKFLGYFITLIPYFPNILGNTLIGISN